VCGRRERAFLSHGEAMGGERGAGGGVCVQRAVSALSARQKKLKSASFIVAGMAVGNGEERKERARVKNNIGKRKIREKSKKGSSRGGLRGENGHEKGLNNDHQFQ